METKFKVNLHEGTFEFAGEQSFVEKQISSLGDLLETMQKVTKLNIAQKVNEPIHNNGIASSTVDDNKSTNGLEIPETFGEYFHCFRNDINDIEKALVTSFYVQKQSESNDFKTSEVNSALTEHGIKLSNPSRALKLLTDKKYIFQTKKVGKLKMMRVSKDGETHLKSLLTSKEE